MAAGHDISVYKKAEKVALDLESKLDVAFSETYGFLTSNIKLAGTGLKILYTVSLPAISKTEGGIAALTQRVSQYEWAIDHVPADFHEGVCPVMTIPERELFSFIDKTGQLAFPGFFSTGSGFSEGLAAVNQFFMDGDEVTGTQAGYIDHAGKMVIQLAENDSGRDFHEGLAKVSNWYDNTAWFIDKAGNKVFDLDLNRFYRDESYIFSEGLCAVCDRDNHWGFLDKKGQSTFDAK